MQHAAVECTEKLMEEEIEVGAFDDEIDGSAIDSGSADEDQEADAEAPEHAGKGEKPDHEGAGDQTEEVERDPGQDPPLGEEEVRAPQVASQPRLPSRDEQDVHEAMGHAQYRRWCEACVHGQGREDRHLRGCKHRSLPVISYDYGFLSERDAEDVKAGRKQLHQATSLFIGRDSRSRMTFAHVIPRKGVSHGSWNFERVNEDIKKLAYRRLILKNDKEPAIVAQVREAQRIAGGVEVVDELSHTGDPQSNGDAEQTVWTVKSKTISVLTTLERNIGKKIPLHHPIVGWAAQYTADCINRYIVGSDGLTVIQRLRGGNPRQPVASFGETVLFPMLKREREAWGE